MELMRGGFLNRFLGVARNDGESDWRVFLQIATSSPSLPCESNNGALVAMTSRIEYTYK